MRSATSSRPTNAQLGYVRRSIRASAAAPSWWPEERQQAMQSSRMLSLAILVSLIGWSLVVAALIWVAN